VFAMTKIHFPFYWIPSAKDRPQPMLTLGSY
jgi:hypothetical protein